MFLMIMLLEKVINHETCKKTNIQVEIIDNCSNLLLNIFYHRILTVE